MAPPVPLIIFVFVLIHIEQVWSLVLPYETSSSPVTYRITNDNTRSLYPNAAAITQRPPKTTISARPDTVGVSHWFASVKMGLFPHNIDTLELYV